MSFGGMTGLMALPVIDKTRYHNLFVANRKLLTCTRAHYF